MFTIAEELILLGTDDEKGTTVAEVGGKLDYGLTGAILAELAIKKRIHLEKDKVIVTDDTSTGISYFNSVLAEINDLKKPQTVKYWVEKLSGRKDEINEPIYLSLVEKGVLKEKAQAYFLVFNQSIYPTVDEEPEENIRKRINRMVFEAVPPKPKSAILLSFIDTCDLIGELFDEEDAKQVKDRIKAIIDNNQEEYNTSVKNLHSAILSAVTASIHTSDSISNSNK